MNINLSAIRNGIADAMASIEIGASDSATNSAIGAIVGELFTLSSGNQDVVAIQQQTNVIVAEYNNKAKETAKKEAAKLEERQKEEAKLRNEAEMQCSEELKNTEREDWVENYVSKGMEKLNTISQISTVSTANTSPDATFGSLTGNQTMKLISVVQKSTDAKEQPAG